MPWPARCEKKSVCTPRVANQESENREGPDFTGCGKSLRCGQIALKGRASSPAVVQIKWCTARLKARPFKDTEHGFSPSDSAGPFPSDRMTHPLPTHPFPQLRYMSHVVLSMPRINPQIPFQGNQTSTLRMPKTAIPIFCAQRAQQIDPPPMQRFQQN